MEAYDVLSVGQMKATEYKQRYGDLLNVRSSIWADSVVDKALSGHYISAVLYVRFRKWLRDLKRTILRL